MPAVFVHGNPETDAIWGPLLGALDRPDVVTLSPPGFGAPAPSSWKATREDYLAWLIGELTTYDSPVDLVGHDWGGGHVMGVAITRPDLLRSWCSDVLGIMHRDYVWHDLAQVWRKPGEGEAAVEAMRAGLVEDRAKLFESFGMTPAVARAVAAANDETMGRCILALYRSAPESVLQEMGSKLTAAAARPGLAIIAEQDTFVGTEAMARECAERAGAKVSILKGVGHWWMLQDPAAGAATLREFWAGLD